MHDDRSLGGATVARPDPDPAGPGQAGQDIKTAAKDAGDAIRTAVQGAAETAKQTGREAKEKGADRVNAASDGAADALRQVADQLKGAAEGLGDNQPWAGKAFQTGADGLERVSDYLATGKFDDFTRDIQAFAKTNPAAFLAGSVALGFMIARVGKTAAHHARDAAAAEGTGARSAPQPVGTAPGGYNTGGL